MNDRLLAAPIGVVETTTEGTVTAVNEAAADLLDADPAALTGTRFTESFPRSASGGVRDAFATTPPAERSVEEYFPRVERWLAVDVQVADTVLVYLRDRTPAHEAERAVDRLRQRLDRVQQIDALVATVLRRVIDATDRTEVSRTVCERLGGTDLYRFVWAGDRDFAADGIRVAAAEGDAPGFGEQVETHLDADGTLPGVAAVTNGETQFRRTVADDERLPRGVRQAAFKHGLQSCLAVPLAYQGTVYGFVSVYSGREEGFSEQERAALETLGSVAGFAIHAIRQEDLLVADTLTEVTLEVRGDAVPFVAAAREADCTYSLDGAVPRGDGAVVCYVTPGADPEGVAAAMAEPAAVADVRWVREDDAPLLQVTVAGETPITTLAAWGATVRSAEYTPEAGRLVAEAPPDADVRRMVEAVAETAAETDLVARAETTRNSEPVEAFRDSVADRLTDRQRTVLRAAYLADYFASPRGSTSEEVAASLDITGPTMLHHLRRAQRKLVAAFLESESGGGADEA